MLKDCMLMYSINIKKIKKYLLLIPWFIVLLTALVGCGCGASKHDPRGEAAPQSLKMTLKGPAELRGNYANFLLYLEVIQGTLVLADYTLQALTSKKYAKNDYTTEQSDPDFWNTVDAMNGKSLKDLLGEGIIKANSLQLIEVKVQGSKYVTASGASSIFDFAILDKAGTVVAGPIQVKWTTAP